MSDDEIDYEYTIIDKLDENGKRPKLHRPTKQEQEEYTPYDENTVRKQVYLRYKEGVHYVPVDQNQMSVLLDFERRCRHNNRGFSKTVYDDAQVFLGVTDAFWDIMNEYNENQTRFMPDVEAFCASSEIDRTDLMEWKNGVIKKPIELRIAIKDLLNSIAMCKKQMALTGKIPSIVFATDFNNNHGYTQKQETLVSIGTKLESDTSGKELLERYAAALPKGND